MKIEIEIRDDISPELAIEAVRQVIAHGKVSRGEKGKMYYCWATSFETNIGTFPMLGKSNLYYTTYIQQLLFFRRDLQYLQRPQLMPYITRQIIGS